jgi:hypothetical protein
MRRTLTLFVALATVALGTVTPARAALAGPTLQVAGETLNAALQCPAEFRSAHEPVLLVHGTTLTAESNWSWNYGKTLPGAGYDVCLVDLPDRARADMQVSTEYVVHAVRSIAERSGKKVDVVGFSQGPLEPRWAIKWWPDMPNLIDDLVAQAGVAHGFSETEVICSQSCIAPFWQMKPESKFLASLNAGDETPGDVSYTSVFSRTDQFVWLAGAGGNPWDDSASLEGASNIAVQDLCPGRSVDHVQVVYDAVFYAVTMDALSHPGPADPGRVVASVCAQGAMPGVDMGEAAQRTVEINRDLLMLTGEHHTPSEPALAAYAAS